MALCLAASKSPFRLITEVSFTGAEVMGMADAYDICLHSNNRKKNAARVWQMMTAAMT